MHLIWKLKIFKARQYSTIISWYLQDIFTYVKLQRFKVFRGIVFLTYAKILQIYYNEYVPVKYKKNNANTILKSHWILSKSNPRETSTSSLKFLIVGGAESELQNIRIVAVFWAPGQSARVQYLS